MRGLYLPGHSDVEIKQVPDPVPGPGQLLLAMRASTICGSDIRAIDREHLQGDPAEMYHDGACVACGFGTADEGLIRADVNGRDSLGVVGLGPADAWSSSARATGSPSRRSARG